MKIQFKRYREFGLFDHDSRLRKLTKLGDPLNKLNKGIDFEIFRSLLESRLSQNVKGKGGRPPYDYVLMFKILILQRYYNLSDHQVEFQINDRMSFMRFLNLTIADDIPDSKTVWAFREKLVEMELTEAIFDLFLAQLTRLNLVLHEGKIIDASFVEVPKQRKSREQNKQIKEGEIPQEFIDNPHVLAQKDLDATWTKKNNMTFYGYKNHVKVDIENKIITAYTVTTASVHDSQALDMLLDEIDAKKPLYADSAYVGEKQEAVLEKHKIINKIHEKGKINTPLTETQKKSNKEKSKIRAKVEHVFGFMEMSMNEMYLKYIGIKRATAAIGFMNLVYNMARKVQIFSKIKVKTA